MSIISNILEEEYERLLILQKQYRLELNKYPKGAISKRMRSGNYYLYLIYRKKEKVITDYIGKIGSEKAQKVLQMVNDRKILQAKLKNIENDLTELKRALYGKKIRSV